MVGIATNTQRTVCEYQPVRIAETVEVAGVGKRANSVVVAGYFPVQLIRHRMTGIGVEFCNIPERVMIVKGLVMNFHLLNKFVGRRGREQVLLNIQAIYETASVVSVKSRRPRWERMRDAREDPCKKQRQ